MKVVYNNGNVDVCPENEEIEVLRHSAAHIMAGAIKRLYPGAKFAYGPATEKGFYYDVDLGDVKLTDADLVKIEDEMRKIVKENLPIKPEILPRDEAIKLMEEQGEVYKVEHIADLAEDEPISFYRQGEYVDMCRGPHITYTKALKAFKLTSISGAYWKNDSNNKMLTRINGTAFATGEELDEYLKWLKKQKCATITKSVVNLSILPLLSQSVRACPFCCPRVPEPFSYYSVLLKMRNRREAIFSPKLRLWQNVNFIKYRVTGITI